MIWTLVAAILQECLCIVVLWNVLGQTAALENLHIFQRLSAREHFIEFRHRESFKTYDCTTLVFDFTIAAYVTKVTNVSVIAVAKDTDVQMFTFSSTFMKLQIHMHWLFC